MYMERRRGGKKMRRTKRFAGFALAACMGVSLLVNVPVGTVSAEEPTEMVVADIAETSEADFEWDGTKITKYKANGADVVMPSRCTEIGDIRFYIFLFTLVLVAPFARSRSHSARQSHGVHLSTPTSTSMDISISILRSSQPATASFMTWSIGIR